MYTQAASTEATCRSLYTHVAHSEIACGNKSWSNEVQIGQTAEELMMDGHTSASEYIWGITDAP